MGIDKGVLVITEWQSKPDDDDGVSYLDIVEVPFDEHDLDAVGVEDPVWYSGGDDTWDDAVLAYLVRKEERSSGGKVAEAELEWH